MPGFPAITMSTCGCDNDIVLPDGKDQEAVAEQTLAKHRYRLLILAILGAQAIHIAAMYTPGLSAILQVEPVTLLQWAQLLMIALVLIVVDELHKRWHQRAIPGNQSYGLHR